MKKTAKKVVAIPPALASQDETRNSMIGKKKGKYPSKAIPGTGTMQGSHGKPPWLSKKAAPKAKPKHKGNAKV